VVPGAQPVWSPEHWIANFNEDKTLRAQRSRARNKRVLVSEWTAERATNHPELFRVLDEWLETRGLPPMHFLVEPQTLGMLQGRRVFVATIDGQPVGFTVLSPVPERNGWLTEQFVRGHHAPNGCIELLIDTAIADLNRDGARFITMGIVPLARCKGELESGNPWWLQLSAKWARAHCRRFYDFGGLEWFKGKFHPDEWEPIYVISKERQFSVRTLYAVGAAFTGGNPFIALARGLLKAVRQEIRWLFR
jgi:phosphatidylglycerol lysyltransferase